MAQQVKNPPVNAGDTGDAGLILGSGRSPGGGNDNPFQYTCLKKPMERGAGRLHSNGSQRVGLKRAALQSILP